MTDNERYRDAAKRSIIEHLNKLRQYHCLKFTGDKVIRTLIFRNVPSYGITDDELLVILDNIIRFLEQKLDGTNSLEPKQFYSRYIETMITLINRALVNIAEATDFIDDYDLPNGITSAEKIVDITKLFITVTDILDAIDILEDFDLFEDETEALRNCIIMGLKSLSTDNVRTILI